MWCTQGTDLKLNTHTHISKTSILTVWQMTVSVHFIVFQTCKHTRQWLWNNHIQDMVSTNKIENIIFIFIYCIPKQMNTARLLKPEFSLYIYKWILHFIYISSQWNYLLFLFYTVLSWHIAHTLRNPVQKGLLVKDQLPSSAYSLIAVPGLNLQASTLHKHRHHLVLQKAECGRC